jgi:hypothetical protein
MAGVSVRFRLLNSTSLLVPLLELALKANFTLGLSY